MPSTYGNTPFGLRDLKITNIGGTTQVDLPKAMTLSFKEMLTTGTLRGDDTIQSVVSITDGAEWELEAGGIDLLAYGLMTGRTVTVAGTTPNETSTLTGSGGDVMPYFKIYGKSVGDGADDIHVKLFKCKLTSPIEGSFQDAQFFVTKATGIAIDDGTNGVYDLVQNETATTLPTA